MHNQALQIYPYRKNAESTNDLKRNDAKTATVMRTIVHCKFTAVRYIHLVSVKEIATAIQSRNVTNAA